MKSEPDSLKRLIKLINLYPNRSKKREHKLPASRMRADTFLQILESKRIKRKHCELYANEFDNFDENNTFLEKPKIPKLTKEMDNLNS